MPTKRKKLGKRMELRVSADLQAAFEEVCANQGKKPSDILRRFMEHAVERAKWGLDVAPNILDIPEIRRFLSPMSEEELKRMVEEIKARHPPEPAPPPKRPRGRPRKA